MKVDDNSFKLADAGIGATVTSNFTRGNFVGLGSTGTGYQTFKYPDIKVKSLWINDIKSSGKTKYIN